MRRWSRAHRPAASSSRTPRRRRTRSVRPAERPRYPSANRRWWSAAPAAKWSNARHSRRRRGGQRAWLARGGIGTVAVVRARRIDGEFDVLSVQQRCRLPHQARECALVSRRQVLEVERKPRVMAANRRLSEPTGELLNDRARAKRASISRRIDDRPQRQVVLAGPRSGWQGQACPTPSRASCPRGSSSARGC